MHELIPLNQIECSDVSLNIDKHPYRYTGQSVIGNVMFPHTHYSTMIISLHIFLTF